MLLSTKDLIPLTESGMKDAIVSRQSATPPQSMDDDDYDRCFLKKATVRSHASFAAVSS